MSVFGAEMGREMEFTIVFQSILIITMMIIIGAILARTSPLNNETRTLFINMIVNVAMPCIILSSIFHVDMNEDMFRKIVLVFVLSIIINVVGIAMGWIFANLFQKGSNRTREIALLSGLGNTGFIGIPLCAALLGPEGALYAAIFDAGVDVTIWTVGVVMLQKNRKFALQTLKSMINIPTAAIVIGLFAAFFNMKPPEIIIGLTDRLAALAAPLAMFYIGMMIMGLQRGIVRQSVPQTWVPITVKLILLPIATIFMIHFFNFDAVLIQTVLIQSMMPTITLASILFARYSADEQMGALTTVLSTLLGLITIPFMVYIMSLFIN
ncbi:AEC family transporter [Siminovitchia fortis]|uniref:AEC family transporter n=2 Tax=Siminovitchia fortis TaxID=254758 RepID=UPI0021B3F8DC|nr:AEC family transporter [Siminovitchia fortis]